MERIGQKQAVRHWFELSHRTCTPTGHGHHTHDCWQQVGHELWSVVQVNQKRPELARMNQEAPPPEKPDRPTTEE